MSEDTLIVTSEESTPVVQKDQKWVKDDVRRLKMLARRVEKQHQLGVALVCLDCMKAGRSGMTTWGADEYFGVPTTVLVCECTRRIMQEHF